MNIFFFKSVSVKLFDYLVSVCQYLQGHDYYEHSRLNLIQAHSLGQRLILAYCHLHCTTTPM